MCMKYLNTPVCCYKSISEENGKIVSLNGPFNSINSINEGKKIYIEDFFIITQFNLLGTNKENEKDFDTVACDVVAYQIDNFSKTFTINKGISDGITRNCAVITPYGLVGYVSEVGRNWATVSPIVDSRVSVSATIPRVANTAIVQGDMNLMDKGLCKMTYVSIESGIEVGDHIETSGAGGIIPAGIYIGKIQEIKDDVTGVSKEAIIKPGVDFLDLNEVLVIKNV